MGTKQYCRVWGRSRTSDNFWRKCWQHFHRFSHVIWTIQRYIFKIFAIFLFFLLWIFISCFISFTFSGLFRRSISMSGTPLCPWAYHTPEQMIQNAYKLAGFLNYVPKSRNDLLNYLRHAPAIELIRAAEKIDLVIDPTNTGLITWKF